MRVRIELILLKSMHPAASSSDGEMRAVSSPLLLAVVRFLPRTISPKVDVRPSARKIILDVPL
jgi:hypothetical protein